MGEEDSLLGDRKFITALKTFSRFASHSYDNDIMKVKMLEQQ
jgi:hypothetical protein